MTEVNVLEIQGYKSLRALNAFHALLLGLKMTPMYMKESYEDFYARVGALPIEDQETFIREAASLVELSQDEVEAMVSFTADSNGIPFGPAQLKSMSPAKILDLIVAVAVEIAKFKIDLVTPKEKKN